MQSTIDPGGAPAGFAARLMLALAMLLVPVLAFAQGGGAPKDNPRLASLVIEVWPEYDRPAALVIMKGALAESVKLPAAVTLRLPAASGGAAAVAYSDTADGNLLNLKHEFANAGEHVVLRFDAPTRYFHIEFYEPIATTAPARSFRYVWPGDLASDRVMVVQEPATATDVAVEPNLDLPSTGQDGLRYRSGDLGPRDAGKPVAIAVRYTKADARPSAEIVKPKRTETALPAQAPPPSGAMAPVAGTGGLPDWALPLAGFVLLGVLGAALIVWQWRRSARAAAPAGRFCVKCGAPLVAGHRFCGGCGAKVA
jgi:hypothetical protein